MTMLEFHALANLFPIIEGDEFDALAADIKANGLREKIVLQEGQILDGRNRYRAGLIAEVVAVDGQSEHFRQFDPATDGELLAFVVSKNLARQHLNDDQRRMVAARLVTIGRGRPSDNPAECGIKVAEAAAIVHVDAPGTERARTVQAHAQPEIQTAVDRGKLTVASAAKASKLSPEMQRDIAKQAEAGAANVVRTAIKKGVREEREKALGQKQQALPDKQFGVILADPEWEFVAFSQITGIDRSAVNHYAVSPWEKTGARDVQKLAAQDCLLLLWVTDLARGIRVLESWGFEYKSYFVWVKDIVRSDVTEELVRRAGMQDRRCFTEVGAAGTGYWNRDRDEICLIGTRRKIPCPAMGTQGESVWFAARPRLAGEQRGRHSAKPENAHLWIEQHYPNLPKIELNARAARPGWDTWGYEAPQNVGNNQAQNITGNITADASRLDPRLAPLVDANGMVRVSESHYVAAEYVTPDEIDQAVSYAAALAAPESDEFEIPAFLRRQVDKP